MHGARALLRPRLRARAHAVHDADGPRSRRGREWPRGWSSSGVLWWSWVRLRLVDERRRPGGGGGAPGDVRRDGRDARGRARRARRVRRHGPALRARLRGGARRPHHALRAREPGRPGPAPIRDRPRRQHRGRRRAARRRGARRRGSSGRRSGPVALAPRHGRALPLRCRGLAARAGALRRAARLDHHHRSGRVDRRHRRRREPGSSTRAWSWRRCSGPPSPRRSGGRTSTSSRSSRHAGSPQAAEGPRAKRDRARLVLPTSTS